MPAAADVVTAGEEAGTPLLCLGSGTNISSYEKKKKGEVTGVVAVLST